MLARLNIVVLSARSLQFYVFLRVFEFFFRVAVWMAPALNAKSYIKKLKRWHAVNSHRVPFSMVLRLLSRSLRFCAVVCVCVFVRANERIYINTKIQSTFYHFLVRQQHKSHQFDDFIQKIVSNSHASHFKSLLLLLLPSLLLILCARVKQQHQQQNEISTQQKHTDYSYTLDREYLHERQWWKRSGENGNIYRLHANKNNKIHTHTNQRQNQKDAHLTRSKINFNRSTFWVLLCDSCYNAKQTNKHRTHTHTHKGERQREI